MACGCNKSGVTTRSGDTTVAQTLEQAVLANPDSFVESEYNGLTIMRVVKSPTGALADFGVSDYGWHRRGDIFPVHIEDVAAKPGLFAPVPQEPLSKMSTVVDEEPDGIQIATSDEPVTDYSSMTIKELREEIDARGLDIRSASKQPLIDALIESDQK